MKLRAFFSSLLCLLVGASLPAVGQHLLQPALTAKFYERAGGKLCWDVSDSSGIRRRKALIRLIDSSSYLGLSPARYHLARLKKPGSENGSEEDKLFTDAALSLSRDMLMGEPGARELMYDEVSGKCIPADEEHLLSLLLSVANGQGINDAFATLEPSDSTYRRLKEELAIRIQEGDNAKIKALSITLNFHRWLHHFGARDFIVVNILPATVDYYRKGTRVLHMRAVVGKPATRTPRFAAYCDKVILYPYWNVPESIKPELLSIILRNRSYLSAMNIQILDGKGRVVSPGAINWKAYNKYNFPYRLRQSTGCDNALGVIKFNLTSPFGVYMHDTNLKSVFSHNNRYFSHGCIRLQQPIELADELLDGGLDRDFLEACVRRQEPITMELKEAVPVFVIYALCSVNEAGAALYHKDVYGLFR